MRFLMFVHADEHSEAGELPSEQDVARMGAFNEDLAKAGALLAAEGLYPSSRGKRVVFDGDGKPTVIDGPFAETKELIAGFWLLQFKDWEEALEWARRCPGEGGVVELRQIFEAEDFETNYSAAIRAQEERLRAAVVEQNQGR
ncbi:YciI family protein [Sciscionella marina]|uniref:YciI family protein n=1 Tax=Sciscionella marina TaxID=508770 RepID=UPI000365C238|nr:YciI family protein [Sciscionella marina]